MEDPPLKLVFQGGHYFSFKNINRISFFINNILLNLRGDKKKRVWNAHLCINVDGIDKQIRRISLHINAYCNVPKLT
jgi:hypothetical protein